MHSLAPRFELRSKEADREPHDGSSKPSASIAPQGEIEHAMNENRIELPIFAIDIMNHRREAELPAIRMTHDTPEESRNGRSIDTRTLRCDPDVPFWIDVLELVYECHTLVRRIPPSVHVADEASKHF
jgi:hypothetical protein